MTASAARQPRELCGRGCWSLRVASDPSGHLKVPFAEEGTGSRHSFWTVRVREELRVHRRLVRSARRELCWSSVNAFWGVMVCMRIECHVIRCGFNLCRFELGYMERMEAVCCICMSDRKDKQIRKWKRRLQKRFHLRMQCCSKHFWRSQFPLEMRRSGFGV